jgi:hypothetical protein
MAISIPILIWIHPNVRGRRFCEEVPTFGLGASLKNIGKNILLIVISGHEAVEFFWSRQSGPDHPPFLVG